MKFKIRLALLPRVIIAIILGIAAGWFLPEIVMRFFVTFNSLFSEFLGFIIPLIILGLVTPAISELGKGAGKMLLATVVIAYFATVLSGLYAYVVGDAVFPLLIDEAHGTIESQKVEALQPFFTVSIPPLMAVISSLILSFVVGLGISVSQSEILLRGAKEFQEIIFKTINSVILPILPLYIFGIFMNITYSGEVYSVLSVFIKIIGVIFILHIFLLLFQFAIAGALVHRNPLRLLVKMLPAYFTALGTQSSAATIPVTLAQTKSNGVGEGVAGFVIPLCATIHMSGSAMKITACALALMIMQALPYDFSLFAGFVFMLAITMVAAPGVPGGCIMAALGILGSILGFDSENLALMIALYIAMDSFGTACNVTGDGAIALIIDKYFGKSK
ncbi:MAG: dicarboxylate/amino acid:cation symporter [Muribaculaceae bacterium]|nr:dicarboxylate/amino acid:cation symporter [Muribaculaceae bacterium]